MIQIVPHYNKKERDSLKEALKSINEKTKTKNGIFTTKALGFQKKYHSTINILKKLRKLNNIAHLK